MQIWRRSFPPVSPDNRSFTARRAPHVSHTFSHTTVHFQERKLWPLDCSSDKNKWREGTRKDTRSSHYYSEQVFISSRQPEHRGVSVLCFIVESKDIQMCAKKLQSSDLIAFIVWMAISIFIDMCEKFMGSVLHLVLLNMHWRAFPSPDLSSHWSTTLFTVQLTVAPSFFSQKQQTKDLAPEVDFYSCSNI